jgi:hypothetical protein
MSWRGTHALQYQLVRQLALRAGVNHRLEAPSKLGTAREPDSGGFILFAALGLVWSPAEDFVLTAELQVPAVNALQGIHDEGVFASLGATYDL